MKKCPFCQEEIQDTAVKCRYCGEWLEKEGSASNKDVSNDKNATPLEPPLPQQRTEIKRVADNAPKVIKDKDKTTKYSRLINASILLGAFIFVMFVKGFVRTIVRQPHSGPSYLGDLILITLVCWAWFRGWKWWALLPPAIVFGLAFIWSISAGAAGGADIKDAKNFALILVLICWVVLGIMIFLKRKPSGKDSTTATKEDAEIEKIIREAATQPIKEVKKVATQSISEVKQQKVDFNNEEFIELLKSTINENGLNTIPGNDLIEIHNRAKSIDASSNSPDIELSKAINTLSDELKKRGLSLDVKPQEKSSFEESSLAKKADKERSAAQVLLAIFAAIIIPLLLYIIVVIISNISNG